MTTDLTGATEPPDQLPDTAEGLPVDEPDWFKSAVFYEVLVRSFYDSNGDGVGDFKGLCEKLDYLAWLAGRKPSVRMLPTRSTAGLFQAVGVKHP